MTRARATALALVNWKGVFYERYLLDPNVTALEGANGAGKTTVMIAAYVVLMPDMSRLRFSNLGETGATGGDKGIFGRLGEPGSSSYAALEITLPNGDRLLAGVELVRKGEPSVEANPFLISGLNPDARLQDLFLRRQDGEDEIATLNELAESAKNFGGGLQRFGTVKEYFATLFELGVSPLRLSQDEDRHKFNEMLRTSMTGGISRALTSELRAFLLREETGLGDTLSRMRGNLDTCRRTRIEVGEAQRLEHEIAGIYEAGQSMFAAALLATREEASEQARAVTVARESERALAGELADIEASLAERGERHHAALARVQSNRETLKLAHENRAKLGLARSLREQRRALELERQSRESAVSAVLRARDAANAARSARMQERDRARDAQQASAQGLADLQKGLDELHRNAHRERRAKTSLEQARTLLGDASFTVSAIDSTLQHADSELGRIDADRLRLARDRELGELRRSEHETAMRALTTIAGEQAADNSYEHAQRELVRLARAEAQASRIPSLKVALSEAETLAARQAEARRKASDLGFELLPSTTEHDLSAALANTELELRAAESKARENTSERAQIQSNREALEAEQRELESRAAKRSAACAVLSGIEASTEPWTFARAQELSLRFETEHERLSASDRELSQKRDAVLSLANQLDAQSGPFPSELLELRDELDAELLAQRFDDIHPERAAALEAELGPLVNALVVSDPARAAALVAGRPRTSESVWLVASDAKLALGSRVDAGATDVVSAHDFGLRVTRVPTNSVLGRRARLERAATLRTEAGELETRLESLQRRARRLEASLRELHPLAGDESILGGSPIAPAREANLEQLATAREREQALEAERKALLASVAEREPRVIGLRALLVDAFLLQSKDQRASAAQLARELAEAEADSLELERVAAARSALEDTIQALRFSARIAGPSDAIEHEQRELDRDRDRWFRIREVLLELRELEPALGSNAAERALEGVALIPALEQQHEQASEALVLAEARLQEAELTRENATLAWQHADAERMALDAQCTRLDAELARFGAGDDAGWTLAGDEQALSHLATEAEREEREERELATSIALAHERKRDATKRLDAAFEALNRLEKHAEPSETMFLELCTDITRGAFALPEHATRAVLDAKVSHASPELWADARSKRELLFDRLSTVRGSGETMSALKELLGDDERSARGTAYLKAWWKAREFLASRVPAQISDVSDPLEALERLRDQLSALERRLARQEGDLRVASEDIARSIEVQLRRAGSQVRRLNQGLDGIQFGSIRGIRVHAERVERMAQVLRALAQGDAQELLFQPTLPIEEALNEVFRRYAGGRAGGHRILDYREYVELTVEILRHSGESWELANPTRLSTGEAIGVGAALMMVVLTEWERDANLLRGKREHGSLRFLFLD
ncbi:MAG TPA: chromosome partition protein MukB, partial [Polyangiaceae bacterium]